jgi:hypothetical protein
MAPVAYSIVLTGFLCVQVLTLNPFTLGDVLTDIGRIRQALGPGAEGGQAGGSSEPGALPTEAALRARLEKACSLAMDLGPPKLRNVGGWLPYFAMVLAICLHRKWIAGHTPAVFQLQLLS